MMQGTREADSERNKQTVEDLHKIITSSLFVSNWIGRVGFALVFLLIVFIYKMFIE